MVRANQRINHDIPVCLTNNHKVTIAKKPSSQKCVPDNKNVIDTKH